MSPLLTTVLLFLLLGSVVYLVLDAKRMQKTMRLLDAKNYELLAAINALTPPRPIEAVLEVAEQPPFVTFPCPCGVELALKYPLEPGQAAVMNCDNCGTSHSLYLPPVQIKPTEQFELVWPFTKRAPEGEQSGRT